MSSASRSGLRLRLVGLLQLSSKCYLSEFCGDPAELEWHQKMVKDTINVRSYWSGPTPVAATHFTSNVRPFSQLCDPDLWSHFLCTASCCHNAIFASFGLEKFLLKRGHTDTHTKSDTTHGSATVVMSNECRYTMVHIMAVGLQQWRRHSAPFSVSLYCFFLIVAVWLTSTQ